MPQYGRPSADTYNSDGYTDQSGGGSNIYTTIDETSYSDADYIRTPVGPTSAKVYVTKLTSIEDPQSSSGHSLRTRYAKDAAGGATINIVAELRQNYVNESTQGDLICTRTFNGVSETFTTDDYSLSSGEADAITAYNNLFVRYSIQQV